MTYRTSLVRILHCLVALTLLLSALTGCAPKTKTSPISQDTAQLQPGQTLAPKGTKASAERTEAVDSEKPGDSQGDFLEVDAADENVVITFAGWEYDRQLYEPLMAEFHEQYPHITVQFAAMPEYSGENAPEYNDYLRMQASTGDTMMLWGNLPSYQARYFRDLLPLIESDPTFEPDDFWSGALEGCQDLEGRTLGVPVMIQIQGIFYHEEAFDAAGIPRPAPDWTWEDFRKAVTALSKQEGENIQYGYAENYGLVIAPLIDAILAENDGEIDPKLIEEEIQWYLDLVQAKAIRPAPYYDEIGQNQDWENQWQVWQEMFRGDYRPAMWSGSLGETMPGKDYLYSEEDIFAGAAFKEDGFAPYPASAEDEGATPAWMQCLGMSDGTRHPHEAWAWLNFLSHRWLVRDSKNPWEITNIPARISVAEQAGIWDQLPANLEEPIRYILAHAHFGSWYPEAAGIVQTALMKVAAGKSDLVAALQDAKNMISITPTPNTTPIVVATPQPTLSPDVTLITYFNQVWGEDRQTMQNIIDAYNQAHPGMVVKLVAEYNGSMNEDYLQGIAANFDCFTWYTPYWPIQKPDNMLNLNSLVEGEDSAFIQDFETFMLDPFRYEGNLYALPAVSQPSVMAYNADLLAKRNLKPPSNDWSFDDFMDLSVKVSSKNESDRSYGLVFNEWDDFLFNGRGAQWADINADPPVPMFDNPDFANALAWIAGLIQDGVLMVQEQDNYMEIENAMRSGKVAFWTAQAGLPAYWTQGGMPEMDSSEPYQIGVAPMPEMDNPNTTVYWGVTMGNYISSQSKNVQGCWDWFKYLSEQPGAFKGVPARKSVANSPEWEAIVGKDNAQVYRLVAAQLGRSQVNEVQYNPISWPFYTWKQQAVASMLEGEDYQSLLPQLQQKAEDYLACMSAVDISELSDEKLNEEVTNCARQADPEGTW